MARVKRWTPKFLEELEKTGMVSEACKRAGVHRSTAYEARQRDEEFAVAWADVEEAAVERLEREAYRRAAEGTVRKVVSAGKVLGEEREYSDSLLTFLLKAKRPEVYRDNVKVEHSGTVTFADLASKLVEG